MSPLGSQASEELLREHYWDLRSKPFFTELVRFMSSGPVVAMASSKRFVSTFITGSLYFL